MIGAQCDEHAPQVRLDRVAIVVVHRSGLGRVLTSASFSRPPELVVRVNDELSSGPGAHHTAR
jgi:hypothetical protein